MRSATCVRLPENGIFDMVGLRCNAAMKDGVTIGMPRLTGNAGFRQIFPTVDATAHLAHNSLQSGMNLCQPSPML